MKPTALTKLIVVTSLALGLQTACDASRPAIKVDQTGERSPPQPLASEESTTSMALVSDGRTDGNEHFFFLPPTVLQNPRFSGTFDRTLSPEVRICALDAAREFCLSDVAVFNMETGPERERIKVGKRSYSVNWKTKKLPNYSDFYRIRVLVQGQELGFADVKFAKNIGDLIRKIVKDHKRDKDIDFVHVLRGSTMPIQFRIEEGALEQAPPEPVPGFSAGGRHTCTLDAAGDIWCAGWNVLGQVGNGLQGVEVLYPIKVQASVKFTSVSAGDRHTCAIDTEQKAWCWGSNQLGQLGNGSGAFFSSVPTPVAGGYNFVDIEAGTLTTCGVTAEGRAYCWGYGGYGNLGNGSLSYTEPLPQLVNSPLNFKSVSLGIYHGCALDAAEQASCWGYNIDGLLGTGTSDNIQEIPGPVSGGHTFKSLALGELFSCGLTGSQQAFCWGNNSKGQLGNGSSDRALLPTPVSGNLSLKALAGGGGHACALDLSGQAHCWGSNEYKELGNLSAGIFSTLPLAVDGGLSFRTLESGLRHTCAESPELELYCWGQNLNGAFGDGGLSDGSSPSPAMAIVP